MATTPMVTAEPARPATLFVMVGLPAVGKTRRAREIERSVGALRLTPDEWMLPLFGVREDHVRRDVFEGRLLWLARRTLALGTSVVLDFGVWTRAERVALGHLAARSGASFELVYLDAEPKAGGARRDRCAAGRRHGSAPISHELLEWYRAAFEIPGADEQAGRADDPPPEGYGTWDAWLAHRWPTSDDDGG